MLPFIPARTGSFGAAARTGTGGPVRLAIRLPVLATAAITGDVLWTTPATIAPAALVVSPDGSTLFITGGRGSASGGTQAYDAATGAALWKDPDARVPGAIAVSPGGSTVFVTGHVLSPEPTPVPSIITLAYSS